MGKTIIGIDSAPKGLAIVTLFDSELEGFTFVPKTKNFDETLLNFFNECNTIAKDNSISNNTVVFIEDVSYVVNVKATLMAAQVLAAVKLAFMSNNIPVFTVNNMTAKKEIVGDGKADKIKVKKFILANPIFEEIGEKIGRAHV